MVRQRIPAPGNQAVKSALDVTRLNMRDVCDWLLAASPSGKPLSPSTLNNYRDGRREMPRVMRRLLVRRLREHARRLARVATKLERTVK